MSSPEQDVCKDYDVIVIGTGLTEAIIAGAASRVGKKVLVLDDNDFYGNKWCSMSFNQANELSDNSLFNLQNVGYHRDFDPETKQEVTEEEKMGKGDVLVSPEVCMTKWPESRVKQMSNRLCLDLNPRVIFSCGSMVKLLVSSGVSRYLEFKSFTKMVNITSKDDGADIVTIPCSRNDIFSNGSLTLVQKRKLMKVIETCMKPTTIQEDELLQHFLQDHKVDPSVMDLIKTVIHPANEQSTMKDVGYYLNRFVESVGRYGPTPLLWTVYGQGELPQAFCRLSAIFGGTFCLGHKPNDLKLDDNKRVIVNNPMLGEVNSTFLIGSHHELGQFVVQSDLKYEHVSQAILLTTAPLGNPNQMMYGRCTIEGVEVVIIELSSQSFNCPTGLFVVHLITNKMKDTAIDDLYPIVNCLFTSSNEEVTSLERKPKPRLLWMVTFNRSFLKQVPSSTEPEVVFITNDPIMEQDYNSCIEESKQIFHKMFPDEQFLPKAPDAEDIVMETIEPIEEESDQVTDSSNEVSDT